MPTLRHTPLSPGARTSRRAGDTAFRALCALLHPCGKIVSEGLVRWKWIQEERRRGTFTTWLYVANGVVVEENLRAIEWAHWVLALWAESGSRNDGIRTLRRSKAAITCVVEMLRVEAPSDTLKTYAWHVT